MLQTDKTKNVIHLRGKKNIHVMQDELYL